MRHRSADRLANLYRVRASRCRLAALRPGDGDLLTVLDSRAGGGILDRALRRITAYDVLGGTALDLDFGDGAVVLAAAVTRNQTIVCLFSNNISQFLLFLKQSVASRNVNLPSEA